MFKKVETQSLNAPQEIEIQEFQFQSIIHQPLRSELSSKKQVSSVFSETGKKNKNQKDRQFELNESVKEALKIDEKENHTLEEKVQEKLVLIQEVERKKAAVLGYTEGYQKGFEEAKKECLQLGVEKVHALEELLKSFDQVRLEIFQTNELFLMELLGQLVKKIILRELSSDLEYLPRLVEELVKKVGLKDHLKIEIHPDEAESLDFFKSTLLKKSEAFKNFTFQVSSEVKPRGCRIQTEWNTLEADLETQLQAVDQVFSRS